MKDHPYKECGKATCRDGETCHDCLDAAMRRVMPSPRDLSIEDVVREEGLDDEEGDRNGAAK